MDIPAAPVPISETERKADIEEAENCKCKISPYDLTYAGYYT